MPINLSQTETKFIELPTEAERYTLSAPKLEDAQVQLNGRKLRPGVNDTLPQLQGTRIASATIRFLAVPDAENESCR